MQCRIMQMPMRNIRCFILSHNFLYEINIGLYKISDCNLADSFRKHVGYHTKIGEFYRRVLFWVP